MITERQAERLRKYDCRWLALVDDEDRCLLASGYLDQWHTRYALSPAGRAALAEYDAAKLKYEP